MPDLDTLRWQLTEERDVLGKGTGADASYVSAILNGLLYVGMAIESLRDELAAGRADAEARHRDRLPKPMGRAFTGKDDSGSLFYVDQPVQGETRRDPEDGNHYVLAQDEVDVDYVVVTDIFGGHARDVNRSDWLSWEIAPSHTVIYTDEGESK